MHTIINFVYGPQPRSCGGKHPTQVSALIPRPASDRMGKMCARAKEIIKLPCSYLFQYRLRNPYIATYAGDGFGYQSFLTTNFCVIAKLLNYRPELTIVPLLGKVLQNTHDVDYGNNVHGYDHDDDGVNGVLLSCIFGHIIGFLARRYLPHPRWGFVCWRVLSCIANISEQTTELTGVQLYPLAIVVIYTSGIVVKRIFCTKNIVTVFDNVTD